MTFLGVRKRREALAAAREDHRRERGASVLQKSFRNWSCRWRAEASRFEAQERLLTFAAGKLQAHWFRALAARLRREASLPLLPERTHGEATANVPRNEGSDNEGEVQVDDDERIADAILPLQRMVRGRAPLRLQRRAPALRKRL